MPCVFRSPNGSPRAGVRVAYDELLARPGRVGVHTLERGIRDAAHRLLVFSPEVGRDGWVRQQYAALMRQSIENEAQRFVPVQDKRRNPPSRA